ncbi:hypothetical protein MPSEU_000608500 [Mayamaea pseudoterrestris]|nr:hypothetical protein MPSEU_000608500 [Mayamaea pseudoterrestris]
MNYHANDTVAAALARPTEAQLRWAQFRFKRRAASIQQSLQVFWQTPVSVQEVDGAVSDDGNTTEESVEQSTTMTKLDPTSDKRRNKPKISRGRRALLRVSKRRFEQRRKEIEKRGFQCGSEVSLSDDDENDDHLAFIFADEQYIKKRRRRQHRKGLGTQDLERARRFDDAFHAMMMTLAAAQPQQYEMEAPTKIWSRPEGTDGMINSIDYEGMKMLGNYGGKDAMLKRYHNHFVAMSPMDRNASWLLHMPKRSTKKKPIRQSLYASANQPSLQEIDSSDDDRVSILSDMRSPVPGANSFSDIVDRLQHQLQIGLVDSDDFETPFKKVPVMKLSKYFRPAILQNDSDEKKEETKLSQRSSLGPEDAVALSQFTPVHSNQSTFSMMKRIDEEHGSAKRLEPAADLIRKKPQQQLHEYAKRCVAKRGPNFQSPIASLSPLVASESPRREISRLKVSDMETFDNKSRVSETAPKPFVLVRQLIEKIEQQAYQMQLVSVDGKLQKPAFAQLVKQYLEEARRLSSQNGSIVNPTAANMSRTKLLPGLERNLVEVDDHLNEVMLDLLSQKSGRVEKLIQVMEDSFAVKPFIDASGQVNETELESIVTNFVNDHWFLRTNSVEVFPGMTTNKHYSGITVTSSTLDRGNVKGSDNAPRLTIGNEAVKQLVSHMERAAEVESGLLQSGRINQQAMERVLISFIEGSQVTDAVDVMLCLNSPLDPASAKQNAHAQLRHASENDQHGDLLSLLSKDVVRELARRLEDASVDEDLVDSRGKLETSAFEELVLRCINDTLCSKSIPGETFAESDRVLVSDQPSPFLDSFVLLFVELAKAERFLGSAGYVNKNVLRHAVDSCFTYVADVPFRDPTTSTEVEAMDTLFVPVEFVSCFSDQLCSAILAGAFRSADGLVDSSRLHSEITSCARLALTKVMRLSTGSLIQDTHEVNDDSRQNFLSESARQIAGQLSGRFGNLAKNIYAGGDSQSDHDAVAAFHRRQDERLSHEDASSVSSFRALPVGFKNVIKRFRGSFLPTAENIIAVDDALQDDETSASSSQEILPLNGSRDSATDFTPQRVREFTSGLLGKDVDNPIIDTDGSEIDVDTHDRVTMSNLMLSPTILTKRHQQAIKAMEKREWQQAQYLVKANPWLAEMTDFHSGQNLLHKLALYGGEAFAGRTLSERQSASSPSELNTVLIHMFPSAAHKVDIAGNLPIHLAAASANLAMIRLLGDHFPSGASVRNEDGMLPLHLSILAAASVEPTKHPVDAAAGIIRTMLNYFPGAVAVANNEGNLPLHLVAATLRGDLGVDVVYLLLDEARKQVDDGLRFTNKLSTDEPDDASEVSRSSTSFDRNEGLYSCSLVLNGLHATPLMTAIHARAGWRVIEALASDSGEYSSVCYRDQSGNNALHLVVSEPYIDPAAALTLVKAAPDAVLCINDNGMSPIAMACINCMPSEVVLALVLVDLPFEVNDLRGNIRDGYGASWYLLVCECDDHYVSIVEEVLILCSYLQVRTLCFYAKDILARATPKCREAMQRALRFLGRFEFLGSECPGISQEDGCQVFAAIDYGSDTERRVILKNYTNENIFQAETSLLQHANLDPIRVEEILIFAVHNGGMPAEEIVTYQHCISIEQPDLTLAGVLEGMLQSNECQTDFQVRRRYADKIFSVLRIVAKALAHLHEMKIVHGSVKLENCGKFRECWKLTSMLGAQKIHSIVNPWRLFQSAPPEAVAFHASNAFELRTDLLADPSQDVWGFGKMAYDVLVGDPLIFFGEEDTANMQSALHALHHWDDDSIDKVCQQLARVGVSGEGIDLITHCLAADPERRPPMEAVLQHPCWKALRRQNR